MLRFFLLRLNALCERQPEGPLLLAPLFSPQIRIKFVLELVGGWQERAFAGEAAVLEEQCAECLLRPESNRLHLKE